jgi:hypothetical protein
MERFRQWILPVSALVLILGAAVTVVWLSDPDAASPLSSARELLSRSPVSEQGSAPSITYRFLFPSEAQATPGRLTLGRFLYGRLCDGATWEFDSIDQWHGLAPLLFEKEKQWTPEEQSGWRISRWLAENEGSAHGRDHLFWSIQALRCLDPESFANEIDMIAHSGQTLRIFLTEGQGDYDYNADTLYWNPSSAPDPLVGLAHELNHAWHDLCRNGDAANVQEREHLALLGENRIRHVLFLKDPTRSYIRPRQRTQEALPEVPEDSAQQAWTNYRDAAAY